VAEEKTEQTAQHVLDAVNAFDILTGLLPDEVIDVTDLDLIPFAQLLGVQVSIETPNEKFNLHEGVFGQPLVFSAELQVLSYLWKKVVSSHGNFQGKDLPLHQAGGPSPAKE
jgi:hypothetical protein